MEIGVAKYLKETKKNNKMITHTFTYMQIHTPERKSISGINIARNNLYTNYIYIYTNDEKKMEKNMSLLR